MMVHISVASSGPLSNGPGKGISAGPVDGEPNVSASSAPFADGYNEGVSSGPVVFAAHAQASLSAMIDTLIISVFVFSQVPWR